MAFDKKLQQEIHQMLAGNGKLIVSVTLFSLALKFANGRIGESLVLSIISILPTIILAIYVHSKIIFGHEFSYNALQPRKLLEYFIRLIALFLIGIPFILIVYFVIGRNGAIEHPILFGIAVGSILAIVFSIWGTWLPAQVSGNNKTFKIAYARGKLTFNFVLVSFILGSGPLIILSMVVNYVFVSSAGLEPGLWTKPSGFNSTSFATDLLTTFIAAVCTVINSTILSRAYLIGEAKLQSNDQ